ncbi:MAG: hypothetical protein IM526_02760 [Microcystis sp. M38BS1]|uniref:hypothetical protein n=1 Tax=Microcystis sp. M38BS1 TaxID=2771188 RepID=UPI0031FCA3BC|nr:hypothetical protein [Microcystis sp. M38BS1]
MPLPYNSGLLLKVTSDSGAQFFADYSLNSDIERFGKEALELGLTGEAIYDYVKAETFKIAPAEFPLTLPKNNNMAYPISKFVEAAEALREEYENAEVTSSDTSITVTRTIVSEEGAIYTYGIEFTPSDAEYDEELVELCVEDLYETLYGEDEDYEDEEDEDE